MDFSDEFLVNNHIPVFSERLIYSSVIVIGGAFPPVFLTPSPYGHYSPYLICDEQRERIESITLTVFTSSEIYGDSPPPLCFAQQNIGEVSEGRRG